MTRELPYPTPNEDWRMWALRMLEWQAGLSSIHAAVEPQPLLLPHRVDSKADTTGNIDGLVMWDPTLEMPVVSASGAWEPLATTAWTANNFVVAGYGAMYQNAGSTAGSNITTTYQTLTLFDTIVGTPKGCTLNTSTDQFTMDTEGRWQFVLTLSLEHNAYASGQRTLLVRAYNVTDATAGTAFTFTTGRNDEATRINLSAQIEVDSTTAGDSFRLEIARGAGADFSSVSWDEQSLQLFRVGEWDEALPGA